MLNRRLLLFLIVAAICLLTARPAEAKFVFFGWGGEKVITVASFPDTPRFKNGDKHFNLGYRFKQVTLFFIPAWNYGGAWCGSIPGDDSHFYEFSREQLENLARAAGVAIPEEPSLGAWDSYGGKLVIAALILVLFLLWLRGMSLRRKQPAVTST